MKYVFRTRPYKHQRDAMVRLLRGFKEGKHAALLMEPRVGKTKTTIDTVSALAMKHGLRKVLIVAPNRVLGTWLHEISVHCPLVSQAIIWDKEARQRPIPQPSPAVDVQFVLVNYDAFSTPGRKLKSGRRSKANGRFKTRTLVQKWVGVGPAACVLDESHKIKSPSGKWSSMIVSMRKLFRWRFILTGTPVTKAKRAHDIYMQWKWMDQLPRWGQSVDDFKAHTGRWIGHNGFPQWVGPRAEGMADLKRLLSRDAVIVRREDCFDLPPRESRIIDVPLSARTARHYDEMAQEMVTQLESGDIAEASIPLVVTLRLQQITGGFVGIQERRVIGGKRKLVSVPHRISWEKIEALRELMLDEVIETEQKVVIGARFVPDLNAIAKLCQEMKIPVWQIRGGLKREETDDAIRRFRGHEGAGAMVIQPAAASLGIDLSTAAQMVWYSLTPSWVDFTQACDRIALSRRSTTFTYLLAEGTVDRLVYDALMLDGEVNKQIMHNPSSILRH